MRSLTVAVATLWTFLGGQGHAGGIPVSYTVIGDHVSIADCSFSRINSKGGWRREEVRLLQTVRLISGESKYTGARIEFQGIADNHTRVLIRPPASDPASRFRPDKYKKIIKSCTPPQHM